MGSTTPQKYPFWWGISFPSNTWFLGPTRVSILSGISTGSADFAQITVECPYTLQWTATFCPRNWAILSWIWAPI